MKKITSLSELMQEIENCTCYCGLRNASEEDLQNIEREYLDCSHNWDDNTPTDEILSGTCAIGVNDYMTEEKITEIYNFVKKVYQNTGTILLISDKRQEYGNDDGEVILGHDGYGADVLAIVEL